MESKDKVGCGYCAHESICEKRKDAIKAFRENQDGLQELFRNGGYTRYVAEHCKDFELHRGCKDKKAWLRDALKVASINMNHNKP